MGGAAAGGGGSGAGTGGGGSGAGAGGNGGAAGGGSGGAAGAGYSPCPATGACKIMPFGDSITEGFKPNDSVLGGYRMELFHLARQDGHTITFVGSVANGPQMVDGVQFPRNHEGHGAHTIEGTMGIAQFTQPSMNNYQPHIILLMIGTNDINGNVNRADAPNRLGRLLDSIFTINSNILVVLAQIVPSQNDGLNQNIRTYNQAIPALVSARTAMGRHLVLIDMYEAFTRDADYKTSLLADNLHPNTAGYTRMAATWYPVLAPYLR
jgi:hypothetical protein